MLRCTYQPIKINYCELDFMVVETKFCNLVGHAKPKKMYVIQILQSCVNVNNDFHTAAICPKY